VYQPDDMGQAVHEVRSRCIQLKMATQISTFYFSSYFGNGVMKPEADFWEEANLTYLHTTVFLDKSFKVCTYLPNYATHKNRARFGNEFFC
jgi:hypothetical protein